MPAPLNSFRDATYPTQEGDMLDAICMAAYGRWSLDVLLPLCNANPWVLKEPLRLPAGRILLVPAKPALSVTPPTIQMWKDAPTPTFVNVKQELTPVGEYDGVTLEDYLENYRRTKASFSEREFVALQSDLPPLYGTLTVQNDEVYRYSPAVGFVGVDRFTLKATNGRASDVDIIEIVVPYMGAINRHEVVDSDALVLPSAKLLFCAVRRMRIESVQVFIAKAETELLESHQLLNDTNAYIDVVLEKRLPNGAHLLFGPVKRLYNNKRTDALAIPGSILNPNECLVLKVVAGDGNVWGLWADAYTSIDQ